MKKLTEEFLNSKRVQKFANRRNIEIITGFERGSDGEDLDSPEVVFCFVEPSKYQTEDDNIWYKIREGELFYGGIYQVEDAEDLPYNIQSWEDLKLFIEYVSSLEK